MEQLELIFFMTGSTSSKCIGDDRVLQLHGIVEATAIFVPMLGFLKEPFAVSIKLPCRD
jgi:hypothetical protein